MIAQRDTIFVTDLNLVRNIEDTTYFKFKAKGGILKFDLQSSEGLVDFEIVKLSSAPRATYSSVLPVRSKIKNRAVLDQQIWNHFIETGRCPCEACILKYNDLYDSLPIVIDQEAYHLLKIYSKGIITSKSFWGQVDSSLMVFSLDDEIDAIDVGMRYELREVRFKASSIAYLGNAQKELGELLTFLEKYSSIRVSIEGHVNGPFNSNPDGFLKLSKARAEKIKSFLIGKGINAERIQTVGKGNSQMRFKKPRTEWQAEQNRRVEVKVISK